MKIRTIGFAEKLLGFREKEVSINEPKELKDVIDFTDVPVNLIAIIVNERAANINTIVKNGDNIIITQIVAGG
ncbi:MAG: sulfur carrier protein ThiS [Asgard group archaeon]|nr:sulfur carrier protein ThiS [Asgard group archaeon]